MLGSGFAMVVSNPPTLTGSVGCAADVGHCSKAVSKIRGRGICHFCGHEINAIVYAARPSSITIARLVTLVTKVTSFICYSRVKESKFI